ncbi:MAG TPA: EAL domain-containing protein [Acetobacteraceae bacterium]|jgi:EAL domain-containing protein (putative c-di-GMP-specific phosphodiesterase class I)|nr:EAL domain-containing protein [Acetobacteraceae bacterium]
MSELHAALAGSSIDTRYQPIVRVADRIPVAVEVLARMNHPAHGTLLPNRFVPQMEDAGLAPALTETVTRRAFADMSSPALAPYRLGIAVNFPLDVLFVPSALQSLDMQRREAGIRPQQVIVELTESRPVEDVAALRRVVEQLRHVGYGVVIDDIQPDVPQLNALLDLPFTGVKLDKAIVQALATDARARAFTDGIVALAATRGLTVTAEGVEDSATWDRLADMGVEQAQGYLIARPLLAIAVPVWLRRWPRRQAAD